MARQGGNGNEGTTGDESAMAENGTRLGLMTTDEYIESLFTIFTLAGLD
jgi:hypothetical protein